MPDAYAPEAGGPKQRQTGPVVSRYRAKQLMQAQSQAGVGQQLGQGSTRIAPPALSRHNGDADPGPLVQRLKLKQVQCAHWPAIVGGADNQAQLPRFVEVGGGMQQILPQGMMRNRGQRVGHRPDGRVIFQREQEVKVAVLKGTEKYH